MPNPIDPKARTITDQAGRPAELKLAVPVAGRVPVSLHGPVAAMPESGIDPLIDLRADPLDQALGDRAVIIAAKFMMRCRRRGDVLTGKLVHGDKIHLDCQVRPCPAQASAP